MPKKTKSTVLTSLRKDLDRGVLSLEDLEAFVAERRPVAVSESTPADDTFRFNLESILSFVGGGIVLFGIFVLVSFNWSNLSDVGQIIVTLGAGLVLALSSFFLQPLLRKTYFLNITQFVAAFLTSVGVGVLIGNTRPHAPDALLYMACFGFLSLVYTVLDRVYTKGVLSFLGVVYFTGGYIAACVHLFTEIYPEAYRMRVPQLAALLGSLVYLGVAAVIWPSPRVFFRALILNIGVVATMITAFLTVQYLDWYPDGGWRGSQVLEHVYGLIFVGFYALANRLQSKVLLLSTSVGLFVWINYLLNVRYNLSNNLGVGLIISGLLLMGIGFLTYRLAALFGRSKNIVSKGEA